MKKQGFSKPNIFIYRLGMLVVQALCLVLLIFATLSTLFVNYFADDLGSQARIAHHHPFINLGLSIVIVAILSLLLRISRFRGKDASRFYLYGSLGCLFVLGSFLIIFGKTVPSADAYSVYAIGESFASSDYSAIHPTDSYLSFYPQQIGLASFYDILIRLFKLSPVKIVPVHLIKLCNILCAFVIIIFLSKTCELLFNSRLTTICSMLLLVFNMPLLFYTSFVYSELPSFACLSIGIYYFLCYLKEGPGASYFSKGISLLFFALSVLLRKNSLVILIAVLLVLLLEGLFRKSGTYALYGVVLLILCLNVLPIVQKIYEVKAGNTLRSGVTATSYFAMGMQESTRGNGWYNGFNFNTYLESGMDSKVANEVSKAAIRERLDYFKNTPGSASSFYREKFLTQWTDGSYFCREATLSCYDGRSSFFKELYDGKLSPLFMNYCNGYQLLLYAGAFVGILYGILQKQALGKKENSLSYYLCLIGVLGGFFFHMLWEANSRYLLLYSFLLIPYCARGITAILNKIHNWE